MIDEAEEEDTCKKKKFHFLEKARDTVMLWKGSLVGNWSNFAELQGRRLHEHHLQRREESRGIRKRPLQKALDF